MALDDLAGKVRREPVAPAARAPIAKRARLREHVDAGRRRRGAACRGRRVEQGRTRRSSSAGPARGDVRRDVALVAAARRHVARVRPDIDGGGVWHRRRALRWLSGCRVRPALLRGARRCRLHGRSSLTACSPIRSRRARKDHRLRGFRDLVERAAFTCCSPTSRAGVGSRGAGISPALASNRASVRTHVSLSRVLVAVSLHFVAALPHARWPSPMADSPAVHTCSSSPLDSKVARSTVPEGLACRHSA